MPDSRSNIEPLERRQFASDNYAGICPEAWEAMARANRGHAQAYGEDAWTDRAAELVREVFETDCQVFFALSGTASNAMSLASMCRSYHSILCHHLAHIESDECGAPEFFTNGTKVLTVDGSGGKVDLDDVVHKVHRRNDIHYPKPHVLSITQPTEMGTVYGVEELDAIRETCHHHGLRLHMDGARFANAVAALDVPPKELTWKVGVDVLCFGGTKNGMGVGETVVFFDDDLAEEFDYRCKQAGQLASKMRYLAAPWIGMLESGAWLEHARHANRCAQRLAEGLRAIDGVELMAPVQANTVFAHLPDAAQRALHERGWLFYNFIAAGGARLMCSWDTTQADVDALVDDVRAACIGCNSKA